MTICPENLFVAPEASHSMPLNPAKHSHYATEQTGPNRIMWASLDVWQGGLERLSKRTPLTRPIE